MIYDGEPPKQTMNNSDGQKPRATGNVTYEMQMVEPKCCCGCGITGTSIVLFIMTVLSTIQMAMTGTRVSILNIFLCVYLLKVAVSRDSSSAYIVALCYTIFKWICYIVAGIAGIVGIIATIYYFASYEEKMEMGMEMQVGMEMRMAMEGIMGMKMQEMNRAIMVLLVAFMLMLVFVPAGCFQSYLSNKYTEFGEYLEKEEENKKMNAVGV
jgi:hypothetical protein